MKKNLFMVAAVAFMALISCNKENINGETESYTPEVAEPSYYVEFTADAANEQAAAPAEVQAKTTYDQTNKKTLWKSKTHHQLQISTMWKSKQTSTCRPSPSMVATTPAEAHKTLLLSIGTDQ